MTAVKTFLASYLWVWLWTAKSIGQVLTIVLLTWVRLKPSSALQSLNWQLIGTS